MTTATLSDLRPVDLFDELDDDALAEFAAATDLHDVAAGTIIAEQGVDVAGLQLLLDGDARSFMMDGDRADPMGHQHAPTWMGAIAALTGDPLPVRMQAESDCRIGLIESEEFRRLALAHPTVHQRVMRQVAPVIGRLTGIEQNRDRLASLGEMSAGLAHELNNPAAAATRAAAQLQETMEVVTGAVGAFVESGVERDGAAVLVALQREALANMSSRSALDALDAADAEDSLLECLEDLGVADAWRYAESLAAAGVDQDWIERLIAAAGPGRDPALRWVSATLAAQSLAADLQESTRRMSALVGAIKSYTYMDRGDLVEVDIHEGIEMTLVVLGHKVKHTAIEVVRDYDRELPRMTVRGSELNQVWTNLLDNAIDALGENGTITITTRHDNSCALVDIGDDGPGIAPEHRDRVFDSFFTTKDVGAGTGLGLATARRIVVDRHDGSLTFDSEPGRTTFHVSLPIRQETA
jgi:signal transduction histidine kinase